MSNVDKNNPLWGLLGFFLPAAGFVLFLVWRQEQPNDARHALWGGIVGMGFWVALRVVAAIIFFTRYPSFLSMFSKFQTIG